MGRAAAALLAGLSMVATPAAADALAACRLPEMHVRSDVGLGFPRIPFRLKTTGELRFRVLYVDFSDAPARQTPAEVMSMISPRAEQFFKAVSYGRLNLVFDRSERWIRMRKPSTAYRFSRGAPFLVHQAYLQEALDLAGPEVDYTHADALLVIANPDVPGIDWGPAFAPTPGYGVRAGGRTFINGATSGNDLPILGWTWFTHEIGHTMSLVDLAGPLPSNQLWHTYVGEFSVMGNPLGKAPELLGWERWQLGWLDDGQISCINGTQATVTITPIERTGGPKLAIVPTGPTTAVVVESRRAEGFDHELPTSGPLVYTIDTRLSTHAGPIRVAPVDDNDTLHWHSLLTVGRTVSADHVAVTLLRSDAQGDTVSITRTVP